MPIRRPVARPADIVALELLVSVLTALEVGLLLQLGLSGWGDPGVGAGQVPGVLAALGLVVLVGWVSWIIGRGGWLLAGANVPVALIAGLLLVAGPAMGPAIVDAPAFLLLLVGSIAGIACGLALPAPGTPRRVTDHSGRTAPGSTLTPFGAAVAGRLHRGRAVTAGAARAASARMPAPRRGTDTAPDGPPPGLADGRPAPSPRPGSPVTRPATATTSRGMTAPRGGSDPASRASVDPTTRDADRDRSTGDRPTTDRAARPTTVAPEGGTPRTPGGSRFLAGSTTRSTSSFDLPLDAPAPRPRTDAGRPFTTIPDDEDPSAEPFPVWPPAPVPPPPPSAPRWGMAAAPTTPDDSRPDADPATDAYDDGYGDPIEPDAPYGDARQ